MSDDESDGPSLTPASSRADVKEWLIANDFEDEVKTFRRFNGRRLLELTKDELKEFLGKVDGTLMFNMLKPYKNAAPATPAPKAAPATPMPSPTVVAAVDAVPVPVATKQAAPAPVAAPTAEPPGDDPRHPAALSVGGGSGSREANPPAAVGTAAATPLDVDDDGDGGNYTALNAGLAHSLGVNSPVPAAAGGGGPSGASVVSRGNPTPTVGAGSRASVASSGGGFNESRASVNSSAMSIGSSGARQGDYTPMGLPATSAAASDASVPAGSAASTAGAGSGSAFGAGAGARRSVGGGAMASAADADDAADHDDAVDAHEEVRRAALSAGVPIVKRTDLELGRPVGQGSYGKVYAGVWRGTDVAVKMLKGTLSADDLRAAHADVIKELKTMRRVGNHKNVVSLLGVCMLEHPMRLCIVTDLMSRGSLLDVLRKGRVTTLQDVTRIASQVAAGMSHLHGEGVVHRDLAARNVLVDEHYNVRVGDFGYARLLSNKEGTGQTAATVGPVRWMSPESMHKQYSARSDVWAFGVTLYEMVKGGEEPWLGVPVAVVCSKVVHGETLEQFLPPTVDPVLRTLMCACWRKEPSMRPTMSQLYAQLRSYLDQLQASNGGVVNYQAFSAQMLPSGPTLLPTATGGRTGSSASVPSGSAHSVGGSFPVPDMTTCSGTFRPWFTCFYDPDLGNVLSALTAAVAHLAKHPEDVAATCLGSSATHIMHVVRRFMDGDLTLLRYALKLLTAASSSPDTEGVFLRAGGLEAAMEAGVQGRLDAETRYSAASLFHSYSRLGSDRPLFVQKGGLHHVAKLVLADGVDTTHSGRGFDVLVLGARTLLNLAEAEVVAPLVAAWPAFAQVWSRLATHRKHKSRDTAAAIAANLLHFPESRRLFIHPPASTAAGTSAESAGAGAGVGAGAGAGAGGGKEEPAQRRPVSRCLGMCAAPPLATDEGPGADALRSAMAAIAAKDDAARAAAGAGSGSDDISVTGRPAGFKAKAAEAAALVPIPIRLVSTGAPDVASCAVQLRPGLVGLYASDEGEVISAMKALSDAIRADAERHQHNDDPGLVVQGNTVSHILYALKTIVASDDVRPGDVRLHQCLRLVSNSALGRRASRKFLGGGLLVVLRQLMFSGTSDLTAKRLISRLCLNLTCYGNSERVIDLGMVPFLVNAVLDVTRANDVDTSSGDGQVTVLSLSKALVNVAAVAGKGETVLRVPDFADAWAALAVHTSAPVRQRAAHAATLLAEQSGELKSTLRAMEPVTAALMPGSLMHQDAETAAGAGSGTGAGAGGADLTKAKRACELLVPELLSTPPAPTPAPAPPPPPPPPPPAASATSASAWNCGMCTFSNKPSENACSMCDSPRAAGRAPAPSPASAPPPRAAPPPPPPPPPAQQAVSTSAGGNAPSTADCDPAMRGWMTTFYAGSEAAVRDAAWEFLQWLRRNRAKRGAVVTGSGARHVMYLVRRFIFGEPGILGVAIRLAAEAALDTVSEAALFKAGGLEAAIAVAQQVGRVPDDVRAHAVRFFFNFTATVAHRAQYAGKGALTLVHTLVSGGSDEAWTRSSPSTGHVYNIVLSLSKTMVNLSCTDASRQHLADWTAFYTTWRRFATHPVEAVRQRAATVASQVLRCPGTKRCIMDNAAFLVEVSSGMVSQDGNPKTAAMKEALSMASGGVGAADRDNKGIDPPPSTDDCPAVFRENMRKVYSHDPAVVLGALEGLLADLKADPGRRIQMALPSCVEHVMYVTRRYLYGSPTLLKAAVRVLGEAVLDNDTEVAFFKAGAIDVAMEMSKQLPRIGDFNASESARLFFNLTFCKAHRVSILNRGGLAHVERMLLSGPQPTTGGGSGYKALLSTAKALFMLACHEDCRAGVAAHKGMEKLVEMLLVHEDKAVRERAGGIVRELGNSRATRDTLLSWKGVVENVKSGPISRDDTNRAREAYKAVFQSDRPER